MILKKKKLVLCALAIGYINSAMSTTVLQCPKSSDLFPIKAQQDGETIISADVKNNWDVKISKDKFTHFDEIKASIPETARLTISIDNNSGKQSCFYEPFARVWGIVLTSKQPVDTKSFEPFSKFISKPRYNATGFEIVGSQLVCQASAGHPEDCYQ